MNFSFTLNNFSLEKVKELFVKQTQIFLYKHNILLLFKKVNILCLFLFIFIEFQYQNQFDHFDLDLRFEHFSYLLDDLLLQEMLTSQTMVQKQ